jgi:hypothetical protein
MHRSILTRLLSFGLASVLALVAAGGCNLVGAAAVVATGPPKIPAVYEPVETRTTVLLIDDLNSRLPRVALRDTVGRSAEAEMLQRGVIDEGRLIASSSARRVTANDTNEARTSIVDVGRAVGAEVVIHVSVDAWTLQGQPGRVLPRAAMSVRVVDAVSNERIWPVGEGVYQFRAELPLPPGADVNLSLADKRRLEDMLAQRMGSTIAKLFYTYERERLSDQRRLVQ